MSGLAASDGVRVLGKLAHAGEELSTSQEQTRTRARHAHAAAHTLEEPDAQLRLQVADLSPQRGLTAIEENWMKTGKMLSWNMFQSCASSDRGFRGWVKRMKGIT
jgi:hypothetical protein